MTSKTSPVQIAAMPKARVLRGVVQLAALWSERHRSRRALRGLDAHMLRDIGVDATQAETEARRPFWQD